MAHLEYLCRIPVGPNFLQVIVFLKEFAVKYLLSLCLIGVVFSALAGCGESAQDKATREAGEAFQKAGAAAEKAFNSMKK